MNKIISKINTKILTCPSCKSGNLFFIKKNIICKKCLKKFKIINNKLIFNNIKESESNDFLNNIKSIIKKYPMFYNFLVVTFSPVHLNRSGLNKMLKKINKKNQIVVNLGSGNTNIRDDIINIDMAPYPNVDIVSNVGSLPLKNKSIDMIINIAVLEHTPMPEVIINEAQRVLKKGGYIYTFFPFIQGFHASPYDYQRLTLEGMKNIHKNFDTIKLEVGEGPTSGFLWILQEYIAILLSFGIRPLYLTIYFIIMVITFPLKYLDLILIYHPMAKNIAGGFIFIGRKK